MLFSCYRPKIISFGICKAGRELCPLAEGSYIISFISSLDVTRDLPTLLFLSLLSHQSPIRSRAKFDLKTFHRPRLKIWASTLELLNLSLEIMTYWILLNVIGRFNGMVIFHFLSFAMKTTVKSWGLCGFGSFLRWKDLSFPILPMYLLKVSAFVPIYSAFVHINV